MAHEPKTLAEAIPYFTSPDNCLDYLALRRWPNGVICPTCGRKDVAFVPSRRLWQCKTRHPKAQFSVKTGTILEDSPLSLEKWLPVMWMVANCKNGVSSWEIHRALGVTQKTAWFMLHRIRLGMHDTHEQMIDGGGGPIETDETFVGGKKRNMHRERRIRYQATHGNHAKAVVIGMLERDKKRVRAQVIPDVRAVTLRGAVRANIAPNSWLMTDDAGAYDNMSEYMRDIINHNEAYVNGHVHTQGIENFWSLLKRGLSGTYVSVEPFHLHRYVDEQVFRFNNRATKGNPLNDSDRFDLLCSQIVGKRLTYAELTDKNGKKPEVDAVN